jgi:predicted Zn-dependent protease
MAFAASNDLGVVLYASRQFDEASAHARASLALAPESPFPHFLLGMVEVAGNRIREGTMELEKAASSLARAPDILGRPGNAYAQAGRVAEARAVLAELERTPEQGHVYRAMVETGLGNRNRALELLEAGIGMRESDAVFVGVDPVFDALRREARFTALCRKLGVPAG